jgi:energy-coupling factor transport system permease protein
MKQPRDMAPIAKFAAMAGFIAASYLTEDLRLILALIGLQAAIAVAGGAGRAYRVTLATLLVGALTLCLFQIFTISEGRIVFYLFPFWKAGAVTDVGLSACLLMSARMVSSVGSIPLMLSLTGQTQVVSLVSGSFRLPPAYTIMLVTALRFIPTFGERMRAVLQAEASRGYHADSGNPFGKMGMVLRMSLPLLVSCARDVDTLAISIESRGFDPRSKARPRPIAPDAADIALMSLCLAAQAAVVAADKIFM